MGDEHVVQRRGQISRMPADPASVGDLDGWARFAAAGIEVLNMADLSRSRSPEAAEVVDRDPWPPAFPIDGDGRVPRGLVVWSLPLEVEGFSGRVEGRTTGGRRACAASSCGGWFIAVQWETSQRMSLCSRGWVYEPGSRSVRMTKGVGLSTTVATDRPNTRAGAPPRSAWPDREGLGPAWQS